MRFLPLQFSSLLVPLILLAACSSGPEYGSTPELRFGAEEEVDGRRYIVGRMSGGENLYYVQVGRYRSSDERDIYRAVALYSRCESHKLIERRNSGKVMVFKGIGCPG